MNKNILIFSNDENKKSISNNNIDNAGTRNYINNSNIINENSSDNDIDNSNVEKEKEKEKELIPQSSTYISEKELRRYAIEYIKVLGLYEKSQKGKEINIENIMEEYEIPKELIEEKKLETDSNLNHENSEIDSINDNKDEQIDFDNDIQPIPSLNHEMKIVVYLSKPKIIGFDGKLGVFYLSPTPMGKDGGYSLIVKNPENMKIIFKIKILEIITCVRKNEKSLYLQNFGTKILTKNNHEFIFKSEDECSFVYQGILYLINNKEDDVFY